MRLLLPGYEGNMNVKWLHRIKLIEEPVMAINETLQYTYRVDDATRREVIVAATAPGTDGVTYEVRRLRRNRAKATR